MAHFMPDWFILDLTEPISWPERAHRSPERPIPDLRVPIYERAHLKPVRAHFIPDEPISGRDDPTQA